MSDKPKYAPGCFGSALSFGDDAICRACPYAKECEPIHLRAKAQLRELFGVTVKVPTRKTGDLPVKVKRIFDELGKTSEEVREALLGGKNPYKMTEGFVGIVCQVLLSRPSPTRALCAQALSQFRGLNEETAKTYTRYALQILSYCDAISIEGDTIKLARG